MNADKVEQGDELLALHSILGSEEFVRDESKAAGEVRVAVELPADFTVALKEGETLRQYEISFLPPLHLTFELPEDYPSSSPPSFTLTCSWLTRAQVSALGAHLADLYQASRGAVVLFTWVMFLKEDALRFLDIHTLLELPSSDEHSTQDSVQASPSEPNQDQHTPESGPTDNLNCDISVPHEEDLSAPSLELDHPIEILAEDQNPDSRGALDSCKAQQNDSALRYSKVRQSDPNSGPSTDYQKMSHDSNQTGQASDVRKAEQTLQIPEPKADYQEDLPSAAGESEPPPLAQSDESQESYLNKGSLDESELGAASLPIHPRESPLNEDQPLSGPSLTLSQTLLSQLLIYDAAQHQKQFATTVFDCDVCCIGWLGSDCVQVPECGHIFCQACLAQFCKLQITEGNVRGVTCPQADCTASPTPAQVKSLVGEELFSRYDHLLLQNTLDRMPDVVYCPRRSCSSAVIREKSSTAAVCSVCSFAFCVTCRKTYHGTDDCQGKKNRKQTETYKQHGNVDLPHSEEGMKALWDDYASGSKQRQHLLEGRYGRNMLRGTMEECLSDGWIELNSKNCPYCFCRIEKNRGCNVMTCSQCRQVFCWACLAKLSLRVGSHFMQSSCCVWQ